MHVGICKKPSWPKMSCNEHGKSCGTSNADWNWLVKLSPPDEVFLDIATDWSGCRSAIKQLPGKFDLQICTVIIKHDWDASIGTMAPNGLPHVVGAVLGTRFTSVRSAKIWEWLFYVEELWLCRT
ncbi:hypothetical protein BH11PLA2_BH11PLA2_26890 [soil metagenome]